MQMYMYYSASKNVKFCMTFERTKNIRSLNLLHFDRFHRVKDVLFRVYLDFSKLIVT